MRGCVLLLLFYIINCNAQGPPPPPPENEENCNLFLRSGFTVAEDDESKDFLDASSVSHIMYNESVTIVDGVLVIQATLPCGTKLVFKVYSLKNNRRELVATHKLDLFEELQNGGGQYDKYLASFHIEPTCPREPGPLRVDNMKAEKDEMPLSSSNQGEYFLCLEFVGPNGEYFGALNLFASIECE